MSKMSAKNLFEATNAQEVNDLIANGNTVNQTNSLGETPLHKAKNMVVARELLKNNAYIEAEAKNGSTPIFYHNDNQFITNLLIKNNANFKKKNKFGFTPLHFAETKEVIDSLIKAGADIEAKNIRDITPIISATISGKYEAIEALAAKNANMNAQDKKSKNTALHEALEKKDKKAIDILLKNNADMTIENLSKESAYQIAIKNAQKEFPKQIDKEIAKIFEDYKTGKKEKIIHINLINKKQKKKKLSMAEILKNKSR